MTNFAAFVLSEYYIVLALIVEIFLTYLTGRRIMIGNGYGQIKVFL